MGLFDFFTKEDSDAIFALLQKIPQIRRQNMPEYANSNNSIRTEFVL